MKWVTDCSYCESVVLPGEHWPACAPLTLQWSLLIYVLLHSENQQATHTKNQSHLRLKDQTGVCNF